MIIDQHAAHERIIYEKIIHRLHGLAAETQKLLFPIVVDIPPYISSLVMEQIEQNLEAFYKVGFSIKSFSGNSVVIEEIPIEIEDWEGGELFIEILKQFEAEYDTSEDFRDSIAKSVACKAAIKAGKKLSRKEMLVLINDLFACQVPYFCPHGRPLMIRMSLNELEKRFKRLI
jgi:DNA mismatch repair protein MutL